MIGTDAIVPTELPTGNKNTGSKSGVSNDIPLVDTLVDKETSLVVVGKELELGAVALQKQVHS